MPRKVRKFTEADAAALKLIKACGFVGVDRDKFYLESNRQIGSWRIHRLVEHGYLKPSHDCLPGGVSQTYRPVEAGDAA